MSKSTNKSHPFIASTPKNFAINKSVKPVKDLTAVVRWPKYIQLQRKRRVLLKKLKIPPVLNQFNTTLNKNEAIELFRFLEPYRPMSPTEKKNALVEAAKNSINNNTKVSVSKNTVIYGLDEVTKSVETKKAKLVIIAHDVVPIDLVCWLPTLCRKMQVPYCIVKGKARLGAFIHMKNAAAIAIEQVNPGDVQKLNNLIESFSTKFINNAEVLRKWGN